MAVRTTDPEVTPREQEEIQSRIEAAHRKKREQIEQRNEASRAQRKKRRVAHEKAEQVRKDQAFERKQRLEYLADEVHDIRNITPMSVEDMHAMLSAIGVMEILD